MTEDQNLIRTWRRRLIGVALGGLTAVTGIAIAWRIDADNRRGDVCEKEVKEVIKDRAMWEWLLGVANPENELLPEARYQLNLNLPLLKCERGSSVPVPVGPPPIPPTTTTP